MFKHQNVSLSALLLVFIYICMVVFLIVSDPYVSFSDIINQTLEKYLLKIMLFTNFIFLLLEELVKIDS